MPSFGNTDACTECAEPVTRMMFFSLFAFRMASVTSATDATPEIRAPGSAPEVFTSSKGGCFTFTCDSS